MIEKYSNFLPSSKELLSLFTTSWLMTPLKSEKSHFPTQERTHSQSLSEDKSCPDSSTSTNLVRLTPKTSFELKKSLSAVVSMSSLVLTASKVATSLQETTIRPSSEYLSQVSVTTVEAENKLNQVLFIIFRHNYSSSQWYWIRVRFSWLHLQIGP